MSIKFLTVKEFFNYFDIRFENQLVSFFLCILQRQNVPLGEMFAGMHFRDGLFQKYRGNIFFREFQEFESYFEYMAVKKYVYFNLNALKLIPAKPSSPENFCL